MFKSKISKECVWKMEKRKNLIFNIVKNYFMKYRNTNACRSRHKNNSFFLLENCLLPKPNFPAFRFLSISLKDHDDILKRRFLNFLFLPPCFTIYNDHFTIISPVHCFI